MLVIFKKLLKPQCKKYECLQKGLKEAHQNG